MLEADEVARDDDPISEDGTDEPVKPNIMLVGVAETVVEISAVTVLLVLSVMKVVDPAELELDVATDTLVLDWV